MRKGDQSTNEVMAGVIHVAAPLDVDLRKLVRKSEAPYPQR